MTYNLLYGRCLIYFYFDLLIKNLMHITKHLLIIYYVPDICAKDRKLFKNLIKLKINFKRFKRLRKPDTGSHVVTVWGLY